MKKWFAALLSVWIMTAAALPLSSAAAGGGFTDVDGTFWAKEEINSMAQMGILSGYEDNSFKPNNPVTREEFASLITRAFYLEIPSGATQTFMDVGTDRWSYAAIEAAKEYLTGYYPPSGRAFFDPMAKATREDVAVALVKTLGYLPDDLQNEYILDNFWDGAEVSPNVKTYVALAVEKQLMGGYEDWTFRPHHPVTRAEAATLLYRAIKGAAGDSRQTLHLNVSAPDTTSTSTFYVSGDVTEGAEVYINNEPVDVVQGQFRVGFYLEEQGTYTYTVTARIPGGKTESVTKTITYQMGAPVLEVTGVPESTDKRTITVQWTVKDDNDPSPDVYVNGQYTYYNYVDISLVEGSNEIVVEATNDAGLTTRVVKTVIFKTDGPDLTVYDVPSTTNKETITLNWTVKDANDPYPQVYVNDKLQYSNSLTVTLEEGENVFEFRAVNSYGKTTNVTKRVTFASVGPVLKVNPVPNETDEDRITISWSVSDANDSYPVVYVDGNRQYSNSTTVELSPGDNTIDIRAENKFGQTTETSVDVTFEPPAPKLTLGYVPKTTGNASFTLTWTVSDENDSYPKVYINDVLVSYGNSYVLSLQPGKNEFSVVASNQYGETTEKEFVIEYVLPGQESEENADSEDDAESDEELEDQMEAEIE